MGPYQWGLFVLCGAGWVADNMWLQGLSVILYPVQLEFHVSDNASGLVITFTMIGNFMHECIYSL